MFPISVEESLYDSKSWDKENSKPEKKKIAIMEVGGMRSID